jgi:UDP-GlcNAc:undecaprenyl-phosphate GlcNAc-1-phosphate transferase
VYSIAFLAVSSFLFCLALTPLVREWSKRRGLVDRPGDRHGHEAVTPRTGGIAVALSYALAIGLLVMSPLAAADRIDLPAVFKMLPATLGIFVIGLMDDVMGMRPWEKLAGQAVAACMAFTAGVQINGVAGFAVPGILSLPLTIVWLLACANAFNLIDGVDGLATGVGLFAALTALVAALLQNNAPLALATAPLAGALLAFLRYNFAPASVFLGDCGSLTIGFILGCFGVIWSQKSATLLAVTAPIIALSVPLVDTSIAILRRFLRRQGIFAADANHIHHRLLARGLSPRRVALVLYGASGLAAAFSLLVTVPGNKFAGLVIVLFCLVVWGGVHLLGYVEFDTARQLLTGGAFRHVLGARLFVKSIEARCARALSVDEFWTVVGDVARELRCSDVRMSVLGSVREAHHDAVRDGSSYTVHIPLSGSDYIDLCYPASSTIRHALAMASIVEVLQGAVTIPDRVREADMVASATEAAGTGRPFTDSSVIAWTPGDEIGSSGELSKVRG